MIDYSIFYSEAVDPADLGGLGPFDVLISAFNASDRVQGVFGKIAAAQRVWLIHPEYQYAADDAPGDGDLVWPASIDEVEQVNALLAVTGPLAGRSVCIDVTGFMRHVLAFLVARLARDGLDKFTAIYSEPVAYSKQEQTIFATRTSGTVRSVRGMGVSPAPGANEYLILGVGYDDKLISEVAYNKDSARVYPMFAFPSLSADMYQQSAIRASKSGEVTLRQDWVVNRRFAPANDPFAVAGQVQEIAAEIRSKDPTACIYLSPLSTKVQALGFALYWQLEESAGATAAVILPECLTYSRETSVGLSRTWSYTVELR